MRSTPVFLLSAAWLLLTNNPLAAQLDRDPPTTADVPSVAEAPAVVEQPADGLPEAEERQAQQQGEQASNHWRYKRHNGRWWYWLPSERWVYWQDNAWHDYVPGTLDGAAEAEIEQYVAPRVQTDLYVAPFTLGAGRDYLDNYYGNYRGYYGPGLNYGRFDSYPSYAPRFYDYRYSPYRYNPYSRYYGYGLRDYGQRAYGLGYPYYGYPYGVRGPYYGYGRVGIGIGIGF